MKLRTGDPRPKNAGRVKGTPNRTTAATRNTILQAFERAGGVRYLEGAADEAPRTLCTQLAKLLPHEIRADVASSEMIISAIREGREPADRGRAQSDTHRGGARSRVLA